TASRGTRCENSNRGPVWDRTCTASPGRSDPRKQPVQLHQIRYGLKRRYSVCEFRGGGMGYRFLSLPVREHTLMAVRFLYLGLGTESRPYHQPSAVEYPQSGWGYIGVQDHGRDATRGQQNGVPCKRAV